MSEVSPATDLQIKQWAPNRRQLDTSFQAWRTACLIARIEIQKKRAEFVADIICEKSLCGHFGPEEIREVLAGKMDHLLTTEVKG